VQEGKGLLVAGAFALGAVALVKLSSSVFASQYVSFPVTAFFQPEKVTALADALWDEDEDTYILNCWNHVGRNIEYEAIGSDIDFEGNIVSCLYCWSVEQTLARGKGNCVCKSAVLASLLLNRLTPERVHMVIGGFSMDGVGGHAWVTCNRGGGEYLVEATSPPRPQPWIPVSSMGSIYIPYAVFSPVDFVCNDTRFCLRVNECDCGRRIQELL
jgi:hypothetical protein